MTEKSFKISLYIPPKRPIADVMAQLKHEFGQASNIHDSTDRTDVQLMLNVLMEKIKNMERTPENGVAMFVDSEAKLSVTIPKLPLMVNLYKCDYEFDKKYLV